LGKTPSELAGARQKNKYAQVGENQFLLFIPGVANFYAANGNSIIIEPAPQAEERAIRLFLLGTTLGVLLMQRGILPLHGSAVALNGRAVIFTGVSGAGKSTLIAAFGTSGYGLLTDDVAAIGFDEEQPFVHPGYPQQKLWRDSLEGFGLNTRDFARVMADMDKYAVPVQHMFCPASLPLAGICEIKPGPYAAVSLNRLHAAEKLAVLINNTYRVKRLAGLGRQEDHFRQCAKTAGQIEVFRLCRPEGVFSIDEQKRLVLQAMG
jgi:hypothetical protein